MERERALVPVPSIVSYKVWKGRGVCPEIDAWFGLSRGMYDAAGLLASGIIPVVRHCLDNLLTTGALVIPASATVFAQVHARLAWLAKTHKAPAVAVRPVAI